MTILVYRSGIMASDSGCSLNGASHSWTKKLERASDGTLFGIAGDASEGSVFLEWVREGCHGEPPKAEALPEGRSSFCVLKAESNGNLGLITARGFEPYDGAPYMAYGSALETAFGALYMGATAEQAVAAAIEHGSGAWGAIRTISHRGY